MGKTYESWLKQPLYTRQQFVLAPRQYRANSSADGLIKYLCNFDCLFIKLSSSELGGGVDALLEDFTSIFNFLEGTSKYRNEVALLQEIYSAILGSKSALNEEPSMLAEILWKTLLPNNTPLAKFIKNQIKESHLSWLEPINHTHSLEQEENKKINFLGVSTGETSQLVSLAENGILKIWNTDNLSLIRKISLSDHHVSAITLTAGGRIAVMGVQNEGLKIWDLEQGKQILRHSKFSGIAISSVAVSEDVSWLAIGAENGLVTLFNLKQEGKNRSVLSSRTQSPITTMLFTTDNQQLICGSKDGSIKVWNIKNKQEEYVHTLYSEHPITNLAIKPDNGFLISGSTKSEIIVWNRLTRSKLCSLIQHKGAIIFLDTIYNGTVLISASSDNTVKIWDIAKQKVITSFTFNYPITACTVIKDKSCVVVANAAGRIEILRFNKGNTYQHLQNPLKKSQISVVQGKLALAKAEDISEGSIEIGRFINRSKLLAVIGISILILVTLFIGFAAISNLNSNNGVKNNNSHETKQQQRVNWSKKIGQGFKL